MPILLSYTYAFSAGDVKGSGEVFWRSLVLMVVCDPSNIAALTSIKVMFGAPQPHAENLKKRWVRGPGCVVKCSVCKRSARVTCFF